MFYGAGRRNGCAAMTRGRAMCGGWMRALFERVQLSLGVC
jgi:hypothetical protein